METGVLITAFLLTLFAGLATGVGGAIAFFAKHTETKFLSVALGFSAGVMIYVSFVELMPESEKLLIEQAGDLGSTLAVISFFVGVLVVGIIDRAIPYFENPHEIHKVEEMEDKSQQVKYKKLFRTGILTALVIAIHNFPEGLATYASTIADVRLGVIIAIAIAIHNIPEGIAVAVPIYFATKSRKKAFFYSFLSGLAEPLGAILGCLLLAQFCNGMLFGLLFSFIAGIMVFISLDQLLPAAREYGEHHLSIYGLVLGMLVMAVSLLLL